MTKPEPHNRNVFEDDLQIVLFWFDLDMLIAERAKHRGLRIVILHRYAQTEFCAPGEEIARAYLVYRGVEYSIPLSTVHLILFDYLCRHRGVAQTATQIARGLSTEAFYVQHGSNARCESASHPRTSRSAVKEQIWRVLAALSKCLSEARIPILPESILRSEASSSNEVSYRILAKVEWEHGTRVWTAV